LFRIHTFLHLQLKQFAIMRDVPFILKDSLYESTLSCHDAATGTAAYA